MTCWRCGKPLTGTQAALLLPALLLFCPAATAQNTGAPTGVVPQSTAPAKAAAPSNGLTQLQETESPANVKAPSAVPAATEEGELGGSSFRIDVPSATPSSWNRKLVIYYHGYQSDPQRFAPDPATRVPNPPTKLISQLLSRGYAVAQPGYRLGGSRC